MGRISGRQWGTPVTAYGENPMATVTPAELPGEALVEGIHTKARRPLRPLGIAALEDKILAAGPRC